MSDIFKKTPQSQVVNTVARIKSNNNDWEFSTNILLGIGIGFLNIPAAVTWIAFIEIAKAYENHQDLKKEKMPETWLKKVLEDPNVSEKGLEYLNKKLKAKGSVSVHEAQKWLSIEEEEIKKRMTQKEIEDNKNSSIVQNFIKEVDEKTSFFNKLKDSFPKIPEMNMPKIHKAEMLEFLNVKTPKFKHFNKKEKI